MPVGNAGRDAVTPGGGSGLGTGSTGFSAGCDNCEGVHADDNSSESATMARRVISGQSPFERVTRKASCAN